MQYLRAVAWIETKEKGQKSAQNSLLSCLEEMFCCVLVAIGMKLCGDRQVFLKLVAADRLPSFSSCPVLQLGWAPAKVTQPASDSLDSTREVLVQRLSPKCLSNTVITSALAHALAPGWHLIWWHVVPLNTSRLAHSLLANQTGETTGAACFVKMVPKV